MANANYVLTNYNGVLDEARNAVLVVSGTNSAIRQIVAPLVEKLYVIYNNTTGGFAITIGGVSGTTVTIPNGVTGQVYCDGTNFYSSQTGSAGNFTVNGALTASGNLAVTGTSALTGNATLAGNLAVTGTSAFTGNATLAGTLAVTGTSAFTGAATMASNLILNGATSGSVTVSAPAVAGSSTAAFPVATGTVMVSGNMPAFSAYLGTSQTVTTSTATKLQLNTEVFDTANAFDSTTNYRFTPTVAGYYQLNGQVYGSAVTSMTAIYCQIYKNGSLYQNGSIENITVGTSPQGVLISSLVYLNGSTDYVELWGTITGTGACSFTTSAGTVNWFNGILIRTA
jgi:cytoskeletal protein CcmA (bactofilin family)